jgi:EthD domain
MAGVSTVALLERKPSISRDLFSRYWRDVHGVMAARIPGFATYVQHHVTPLTDVGSVAPEPFEGIALVTYACEADRNGLIHSAVTPHIHRDEQNVFRRALLYNLGKGESRTVVAAIGGGDAGARIFVVVPDGIEPNAVAAALHGAGATAIDVHDLTGGDPGGWNDTDVDDGGAGRSFVAVLMVCWADEDLARAAIVDAIASSGGALAAYRTDARYVMVEGGRPTPLGLRGLDALNTINEAGAANQLERAVEDAVYGRHG